MATLKEQDIVLHAKDAQGNPVIQLPITRLENVEGQDTKLVHTTGSETVAGTKTFSSSPIAPTPTAGDNSTKVATTAFVTTAVANKTSVSGNAGTATKLATARSIALSGDVSGSVSFDGSKDVSITATVADDSHNHVISNVDGLQSALDAKAPLASPALTGTPTAPTAAAGTNTTQIATTAFVTTVGNAKAPTSHASSATTYGIGTGSNYGHVKLSDSTSSTSTTSSGVAATPKAVKAAYDLANTANTTANTKAADSAVVKLTGDQSIAGAKTFTETIHTNHSITNCKTVPSSNEYQTALVLRDTQGQAFGHLQTASYADTESVLVKLSIIDGVRNGQTLDGAALTHAIGIGMDKDGNHFTHAPTPSAGDDSNQIATTKWVNDEAVHKAGTETISGAKTFSAATTFSNTVNLNASVMGGASRDLWFAHASGGTKHRTVLLSGNAYADGASLYLHAKDQTNAGRFDLVAHDGTNSKVLTGKPDGALTWGGKDVICVESWRSGANWYRKYSDGFIEQGGYHNDTGNGSGTNSRTCTLNTPFTRTDYNVSRCITGVGGTDAGSVQPKGFGTLSRSTSSYTYSYPVSWTGWEETWYACGY